MPEVREIGPGESHLAYTAMRELRPHYKGEGLFVTTVDEMRAGGYRLIGSFPDGGSIAVAVAGFRIATNLPWGRHLYVDDLSTHPRGRGQGHAGALLDWLEQEARRHGCGQMHLDSGVGLHRADAHRLYLNKRFVISAHHFQKEL